jgi:hypothetical protein
MSHFEGHFEGVKISLEMAHKVIVPPKKNYIPQFLKQRDINSYFQLLIVTVTNGPPKNLKVHS